MLARHRQKMGNYYLGRAVQVHPVKPTLKAPGTERLKLKYDKPLSSFAIKSNLRCYTLAASRRPLRRAPPPGPGPGRRPGKGRRAGRGTRQEG